MFERALKGSRGYWAWLGLLSGITLAGFACYLGQWFYGLAITGMGRDVSWGLYIANFTFLVGVAASAVVVVLPYYLHDFKAFGVITVFGEFLAVAAVTMSILFIFVDLGQPARVFNVIRYPSPASVLFWDMVVLISYLFLNLIVGWRTLEARRQGQPPAAWLKPFILLSIPAAIAIHTVTAFIYAGLGARPFWMTALLAPRFLASAFASGPSLLIILCLVMRRLAGFNPAEEALRKVIQIVTYALCVHLFFLIVDIFTIFYGQIPGHMEPFLYILRGAEGHGTMAVLTWVSLIAAVMALILLLTGSALRNPKSRTVAMAAVVVSVWIEKGPGFVMPGFVPSPMGELPSYAPTLPEIAIALGVYGLGGLILTVLYKIALSVKQT
jgi:Ni/Fe-hydrogenase subunit HybB-like protein